MDVDFERECPVCKLAFDDLPRHVAKDHLAVDRNDWTFRMTVVLECWCGFKFHASEADLRTGRTTATAAFSVVAKHLRDEGVWAHWLEHVMGATS